MLLIGMVTTIIVAFSASGVTRDAPKERLFCSGDRSFAFRIEPGPLDLSGHASGTLYRYNTDRNLYEVEWRRNLPNRLSPKRAFVTNDGRFVITIDDEYGTAGPLAIVIYDEDGIINHSFAFQEFFPEHQSFPMLGTHPVWAGAYRLDDNDKILVLKLYAGSVSGRLQYREMSLFIESGKPTVQNDAEQGAAANP